MKKELLLKLKVNTGVFVYLPILKTIVGSLMKKFLDLTDHPYWRGQAKNLMRAHHATLRLEIDSAYRDRLIETLESLCPDNELDWDLVRVGPEHDGGYWVPSRFTHDSRWITFGLGENVEFENHLLRNGCIVDSFDHSVARRPKKLHKGVRIHKSGISNTVQGNFINLASVLRLTQVKTSNWCLKSDIEGAEYQFLPDLLSVQNLPQVIVIEFHDLLDVDSNQFAEKSSQILKNLRNNYYLAHVNVNNFASLISGGGFLFPDVVEVVYILRDIVPSGQSQNFMDFVKDAHKFRNNPLAPHFQLIFPGDKKK